MAVALEFYKASTTIQGAPDDDVSWKTYLTCNVNRTGKAATKNFFVICHISTTRQTSSLPKVRLYQDDSIELGICDDGLTYSDSIPHGYTYNFVKRISLDASSHNFKLQIKGTTLMDAVYAENASIVVLEESANAQYAEKEVEEGTGESSSGVAYLSLAFTPPTTENYLIITSCETMCEDESDAGVKGISFYLDAVFFAMEFHGELVGPANDNIYRTVSIAAFKELASGAERTIILYMRGDGVNDEVYCRKGYIIAIPFSDFENVYSDSQAAKTFHTTTQSDTDVVLASQACNAADHLVIAGVEASNETGADAGFAHLISAGPVDFPAYNLDDRDEDLAEYYLNFMVHGVTLSSGNYDFEIEGDSSSDSNEGCVNKAYLVVCEIPTEEAPPPVYIPKVIMITGILGMIALKIASYLKIMLGGLA